MSNARREYMEMAKSVKAELDTITEAVEQDAASAQHGSIDWGDVGDMGRLLSDLRDITRWLIRPELEA